MIKFLKKIFLSRFGILRAIISDGGKHFYNKPFETLMKKYGIIHKVSTSYHLQINGGVELANKRLKNFWKKWST